MHGVMQPLSVLPHAALNRLASACLVLLCCKLLLATVCWLHFTVLKVTGEDQRSETALLSHLVFNCLDCV